MVGEGGEIGGEFFARVREGFVDEIEDVARDERSRAGGEDDDLGVDFGRRREEVAGDDGAEMRSGEVFYKEAK